jgi:hypothetical protein
VIGSTAVAVLLVAAAGCGDDDDDGAAAADTAAEDVVDADVVTTTGIASTGVASTAATTEPSSVASETTVLDTTPATLVGPACRGVEHLTETLASEHVADDAVVAYDHLPPAAGPHAESVPEAGIHAEAVPYVQQVSALELGFVVLQYDPAIAPTAVEQLAQMAAEIPELVLTPSPGPIDDGAAIAATTWERRELCDAVDLDELRAFYADRGAVETGH